MNTNSDFLNIDSHSQYEVNIFGDVRKKHNGKLQTVIDGKVRIISDRTCKRTLRSVNAIVADAFYPDPELKGKRRRDALVFYEGIGFRPRNNGSEDENLLLNLIVGNCDYKLFARKNYNNDLTFCFNGKMKCDKDIVCLVVNEKKDEYTLYDSWEDAENSVCDMDGDEVYYLSVNSKRPKGVEGDELLEHLLMAKYYYIKAKVKEDDIECDLEQLKQKYLSYDFEERYDKYDAELVRYKHPEDSESKLLNNRVVKPKKRFEEEKVFTEEEKEQMEEERREENQLRRQQEIQRQYQMDSNEKARRNMLELEEEKTVRALEGQTAKAIRRYNTVFKTNFNSLDQMCRVFDFEVKQNRQRKQTEMRQKEKDIKKEMKIIKKAKDKLNELN